MTHGIHEVPWTHLHESSDPDFIGDILHVIATDGIHSDLQPFYPRDHLPVVLWASLA